MIPVPFARVIIAASVLATTFALPSPAAEKLPAHSNGLTVKSPRDERSPDFLVETSDEAA
jgi:hypothetical protein